MVLIVNTAADSSAAEELKKQADEAGADAELIDTGSLRISHCIGCNHCWLKTPGKCAIKDDYEIILKKAVHADQIWTVSDTALGFLDHKGKNIFDRILPIATMYLHFVGDQMRHVPRYDKRTDVGIVYTGEPEVEYLKRWTARTALNFGSRSLGVFGKNQMKEAVSCML